MARAEHTRDTLLFPFGVPNTVTLDGHTAILVSPTTLFIPGMLVDYYNRRGVAALGAELRNAELSICAINQTLEPLARVQITNLGNPDRTYIRRLTSQPRDISYLLRSGQDLVLGCFARRVSTDDEVLTVTPVVRHVTLMLLLGESPL